GYTTAAEIYGSCDGGSSASGDMPGRITFHTRPDGAGQSMKERLRIKSNGQIVLGSDGTNSELTFTQDGTSGTQLNATTTGSGGYNTLSINSATFIHKYGTNERLRINSDGKVGIATGTGSGLINTRHGGTNQQVLHIRADLGSSNGRSLNLYTPDTDNTNAPFRFQTGNGYLFQCDSEDVFTINHDRTVGVGTDAPVSQLNLKLSSRTSGFRITDSG
ncbi:MAG: hypothetical protein VXY93_17520, partial [Pseudomonadota bacterium]|nr:hypothetical protein [Pseudomonadota bacterium]